MNDHTIIAGFGLPGRMVAETLDTQGVPYVIIELNPETVSRLVNTGTHIVAGDVRDPAILSAAEILTASMLVLTVPDDLVVLGAIEQARKLNPNVKIVARCLYTSSGLEAAKRGAAQVVVAEQLVAVEFSRIVARLRASERSDR